MTEEDEQNRTVLRARRRNSNNSSNGANGASNNGHSHAHAEDPKSWGWTRSRNPFAGNGEESRQERNESQEPDEAPRRRRLNYKINPEPEPRPDAIKFPFDPWRLFSAVKRRWSWLVIGAAVVGGLAFLAGDQLAKYKVSVNIIRRQVDSAINNNEQDPNRPRALSEQTLYGFMRSGQILRRVAERAATNTPPIQVDPMALGKSIAITPTANPDVLTLTVSGRKRSPELAAIANLYAEEVVRYTRDMQASESGDVASYLTQKVRLADEEWTAANKELLAFQKEAGITGALEREAENYQRQITDYDTKWQIAQITRDSVGRQVVGLEQNLTKINPNQDKIKAAEDELIKLKILYTEEWPQVIQQRQLIEALKKGNADTNGTPGVQTSAGSFANSIYMQTVELKGKQEAAATEMQQYEKLKEEARSKLTGLSDKSIRYAELLARVKSLEATRQLLTVKQRDSQLYVDNAMGFYRMYGQANSKDINWKSRWMKIGAMTALGACIGLVMGLLLACFTEASDTRLKTVADIERTTKLPVLATLGDLEKMSPNDQINWAFRTLTILRGKLCATPDDALVCGFISSQPGEGRSTWVNLLVSAASQRGLRVLTVDTRPTAEGPKTEARPPHYPAGAPTASPKKEKSPEQTAEETAAANDLLAKPMAVAERLKDPESIVHIPIPGWVWSLNRRQQWQEALAQWREIDNTVILIELPPASCPEAILLAEKIPQLIWLTGSGMADVKDTREQLETLRHAHCNIVGAALNQAPPPPMNTRVGRWFNWATAMVAVGLGLCGAVQAQEKLAFSATASAQPKRAAWQQHLTLGPGDAMDISLFNQPTLTRTNIFVGPDGRISYLQAQGIMAKGLTIEELRARLDQELAKYHNNPRTIVIPTAFVSKKYYVLGKVVGKGVYSLDRPLTIVEAVARAQGLETGLYDRNTVEMADLSRSFLVRGGNREKVDLEKLFLEGDLSQNIALEPDDFLFFGSATAREIYVLGEVMNPGPIGFVPDATVITAITDRSGFSPRAYKNKILVVRGSLNKPEPYIIDASAILKGEAPDFKLQSHDIVYISHRPWIRAEELLDEALQSFIQGFVTAFAGAKIGPFISNPIFGQ